jgi:hypothetical protein
VKVAFIIDARPLQARLERFSAKLEGEVLVRAATEGLLVIGDAWKRKFRGSSEPSIPGQPVRVQTGTYRRSIQVEVISAERTRAELAVGTNLSDPPYPLYDEYGTARMPAHPTARPAWDESRHKAAEVALAALQRAVREAAG